MLACRPLASWAPRSIDSADDGSKPLVLLERGELGYPGSKKTLYLKEYRIEHPTEGGHIVVGPNGSGKTLLSQALVQPEQFIRDGRSERPSHRNAVAHVSFQSHQKLLEAEELTVTHAIGNGTNLTKAAQFLVVRFGMFHLLHRQVRTLSTGEIRKVLIIRALAQRPKLLILDHAFDGLDPPSRRLLQQLISQTLRGFRQDVLVQAVDSRSTAHTQVLLLTHRPSDELVPEMRHVLKLPEGTASVLDASIDLHGCNDTSLSLPPRDEIRNWWGQRTITSEVLVQTSDLQLQRGSSILLQDLTWCVRAGDRWWIAGGNGQGKSTLSRLLVDAPKAPVDGLEVFYKTNEVSIVSTETHMALSSSTVTLDELVADRTVLSWFFDQSLWDRPFSELSQGQQKLGLISLALSAKPRLLILDEVSQGLDSTNRAYVARIVDRLCQVLGNELSLIYITHHWDEVPQQTSHAMHLKGGRPAYCGCLRGYDPEAHHNHDARLDED